MNRETLDIFGSLLMRRVRDQTISEWDKEIDGEMKGLTAQHIEGILNSLNAKQINVLHQLIPRIVDTSLFNMLIMLEEEKSIQIAVHSETGVTINLRDISDGLAGELYGSRGWISQFSHQRYEPY